jgi:predicted aspartyl protease
MPYPFDAQFVLPFPQLPVVIRKIASTDTTSEITALLDTGADATLVPKSFLEQIHADELYATRIRSHWGEWRAVTVYVVDLVVAGENLPAIEIIADE